MENFYKPAQPENETALLNALDAAEPWALIERFTTLVRESASEDERIAADYIVSRLKAHNIPFKVYQPDLFLSVPIQASLEVDGERIRAKTPSFSSNTGEEGVTAEVIYLPGRPPKDVSKLFHFASGSDTDVRGKIVITDGYGFPEAVRIYKEQGAVAQIFVNPGVDIHWGICTTIWGAPDLDSAPRQPKTPVASISRPDGEKLIERAKAGGLTLTVRTELKEGWFPCPLIEAEIKGAVEPDRFMLVHGHYDSWDVGIGDNAVGDATLLELARVLHEHRDSVARSVKIAWWPGHSTGRYAGSTWYADTFGLELSRNCIAQVDIDSPGCRWATEYYDISWMKEAEAFCQEAIHDVTGKDAEGERPHQAGDYSFNNIGITSFFMLLSTMPKDMLKEKGYYPVGGCGANIAWHTENDTLEIADKDNLMRDLKVYVATLQRVLNNPVHPFDFRALAKEFSETVANYADAAKGHVDFHPVNDTLAGLRTSLDRLYARVEDVRGNGIQDTSVRAVNDAIIRLARILVPINYTRHGRFRNEPAVPIAPLPDIAPALDIPNASGHDLHVLKTHVLRGVNRVADAFERATEVIDTALSKTEG